MDALWGTAWDAVPRGGKGGAQEQLPPRGEGGGWWWWHRLRGWWRG